MVFGILKASLADNNINKTVKTDILFSNKFDVYGKMTFIIYILWGLWNILLNTGTTVIDMLAKYVNICLQNRDFFLSISVGTEHFQYLIDLGQLKQW